MLAVFHFTYEDDHHATDEVGILGLLKRYLEHRDKMPLPMRASIGKQVVEYREALEAVQLKKLELGQELDTPNIVSEQPTTAEVFQFPETTPEMP